LQTGIGAQQIRQINACLSPEFDHIFITLFIAMRGEKASIHGISGQHNKKAGKSRLFYYVDLKKQH